MLIEEEFFSGCNGLIWLVGIFGFKDFFSGGQLLWLEFCSRFFVERCHGVVSCQ